jgi:cell division protein FtsN
MVVPIYTNPQGGAYQPAPQSYPSAPQGDGYQAAPQSYPSAPQAYQANPQGGGYQTAPQGYPSAPQGYQANPQGGGYQNAPQGYQANPQGGGYQNAPQGYPSAPIEAPPSAYGQPQVSQQNFQQQSPPPSQRPVQAAPPQTWWQPNYNLPPATVKPAMPAANSSCFYRVQVGAYKDTDNAREAFNQMAALGFSPAYESHNALYRVVLPGVRARDMPDVARLVGYAGIREVIIREER